MKKLSCVILLIVGLCCNADAKQWLMFYSQGGFPGHGFVTIFTEDPVSGKPVVNSSWGFHPKDDIYRPYTVDGHLKSEPSDLNKENGFLCEVDDQHWKQCQIVFSKWNVTKYQFSSTNCIAFLNDLAITIGLKVPSHDFLLPNYFVNKLKILNIAFETKSSLSFNKAMAGSSIGLGAKSTYERIKYAMLSEQNGQIALLGKVSPNEQVTIIDNIRGLIFKTNVKNIKAFRNQHTTTLLNTPTRFATINVENLMQMTAIIGYDVKDYHPISLVEVNDVPMVNQYIKRLENNKIIIDLLNQNSGIQSSELLKIYKDAIFSNTPLAMKIPIPKLEVYLIRYKMSNNTLGPQVIIINGTVYPLTGQCSQTNVYAYQLNGRYFLRTGSFCCECGISADQVIEFDGEGIKSNYKYSGRAD